MREGQHPDARHHERIDDAEQQDGHDRVQHGGAEQFLAGTPQSFDIAFLDPPFASGLLGAAVSALEARGWMRPGGVIYLEHARREPLPALPSGFQPLRSGAAGEVGYHLFEYQPRS